MVLLRAKTLNFDKVVRVVVVEVVAMVSTDFGDVPFFLSLLFCTSVNPSSSMIACRFREMVGVEQMIMGDER